MQAILDKIHFGTLPDGREVSKFILKNSKGLVMEVINYGAIITSLQVPDRTGKPDDIVLGFDNLNDYLTDHPYFGAVVGRYANRIANSRFTLDGKEYALYPNLGKHHLHGGKEGFDRKLWNAEPMESGEGITMSYTSQAGEEGYPGTLDVKVSYLLTDDNELVIKYSARCDAPTVHNLTQHTYFNLNGARDTIKRHEAEISSVKILETTGELIPTGEVFDITGTAFDFSTVKTIGKDIEDDLLTAAGGYDHCYVLEKDAGVQAHCARVRDPDSGRIMDVYTTEPGFQFYTANSLGEYTGKGRNYGRHMAFCIETQHFPDSPNHPEFPSTRLDPGREFTSETRYKFSAG